METETAVNPPTTENEQVKCSYCGDSTFLENPGGKNVCKRRVTIQSCDEYFLNSVIDHYSRKKPELFFY